MWEAAFRPSRQTNVSLLQATDSQSGSKEDVRLAGRDKWMEDWLCVARQWRVLCSDRLVVCSTAVAGFVF